jgi:hypothetical protein
MVTQKNNTPYTVLALRGQNPNTVGGGGAAQGAGRRTPPALPLRQSNYSVDSQHAANRDPSARFVEVNIKEIILRGESNCEVFNQLCDLVK